MKVERVGACSGAARLLQHDTRCHTAPVERATPAHQQSHSRPGSSMATLCELTRWVTNKASRVNLSSETILVPLYLSMGRDQLYQEVVMDQQKAKE